VANEPAPGEECSQDRNTSERQCMAMEIIDDDAMSGNAREIAEKFHGLTVCAVMQEEREVCDIK
jgi:hypothetical protein